MAPRAEKPDRRKRQRAAGALAQPPWEHVGALKGLSHCCDDRQAVRVRMLDEVDEARLGKQALGPLHRGGFKGHCGASFHKYPRMHPPGQHLKNVSCRKRQPAAQPAARELDGALILAAEDELRDRAEQAVRDRRR